MPFRQPSSSTIRQTNFRDKSCTFPVESVLPAESGGGQLQIDVTNGYLLTTSTNGTPQDQQSMTYESQDDGSWLLKGTITITTTLSSLINGTVTLHDPQGEAMGIAIQIDPVLFIDTDILSFDNTKPNETSSAVLTIRQQGAVAPVILTLDPPAQFTLADAKRTLITASTLTVLPPFEGSNVIVSYKPNRMGRHTAKLVITTPYDTKTVTLVGQTGGLLGWLPRSAPSTVKRQESANSTVGNRALWLSVLLIAVVGGLLWAGYAVLSHDSTTSDVASISPDSASVERPIVVADEPEPVTVPAPTEHKPVVVAVPAVPKPTPSPVTVAKRPASVSSKPKPAIPPGSQAVNTRVTTKTRVAPKPTAATPKVAVFPTAKPVTAVPKPTSSRVAVTKVTRKPIPKPVSPVIKSIPPKVAATNRVAPTAKPTPASPISPRVRTKPHFTVIAGVFSSRQNAIRQMLILRKAGYSDAFVIPPVAGQKNVYKVAAAGSFDRTDAIAKVGAIRQIINSNPWLLEN